MKLKVKLLNHYEAQAQAFLDRFGIKFRATLSDSKVAPWVTEWGEDGERHHYRVTLSRNGLELQTTKASRITFDFFGSIAAFHNGKHPTPYDVLACISSDAYCPDTFKDWCNEFGESEDSIKALQTYRRCSAFSKRLQSFFTPEERKALQEIQ